ncbi:hypothetical protein [Microbacterium sp. A93]|uniref:hypothetical protein n=1 Tax=Microbacterium sp. A93 TaxID=3450716 RepID=UPI003F424410
MTFTIDDRPTDLLDLLWLREAYELQPHGDDLPPLLVDTPAVVDAVISAEVRAEWEEAWPRVWNAVAAHTGAEVDHGLFEDLQRTADGSAQRTELLRRIIGPTWQEEFGGEAFDTSSYDTWVQRGIDAHMASVRKKLENSPERRDLTDLIAAWRTGVTKIVTIPCEGEFTRRITANALLVTDATREDSARYRVALGTVS